MAGATVELNGVIVHLHFADDYFRFHIGNRYVWMEWHNYCGPSFYWDRNCTKMYDPVDENDPIWDAFGKWLEKRKSQK
ncbi:MAG TPA: hypothetical protein VFM18_10665 [Methanosarcina sp.]|nr:hypothetical protein [Methanosarcina sp.]